MIKRVIGICILAAALAGCAVGNKIDYRAQSISLNTGEAKTIALGVQDERPYVKSGDKTPQFVGIQRGGFGNPFNVQTESGAPLVEDFKAAISSALTRSGAKVVASTYASSESLDAIKAKLVATPADRHLLITFKEWKTDSLMNTSLHYNITARVLGSGGDEVAEKQLSGKDKISGNVTGTQTNAGSTVPAAFSRKLQALLSDPAIAAALK